MITTLYSKLAFLGANSANNDSLLQIKIMNCITIMIMAFMLMQLPLIMLFWGVSGFIHFVINLLFLVIFAAIPLCNYRGHFITARSILMSGYVIYIGTSSLIWSINLHLHYFFIIAIFVSPFLYRNWERQQIYTNLFLYLLCFLVFQWFWLSSLHSTSSSMLFLQMSNSFLQVGAAIISSLLVFINSSQTIKRHKKQHKSTEQLLRQTLPAKLVNQLINKKQLSVFALPIHQHVASVLFADMQNYTMLCRSQTNMELVDLLNSFYQKMDDICSVFALEKIKTNGDQYMATCGVLESTPQSSLQCCQAAQAMISLGKQFSSSNKVDIQLRIGIATGKLASGFVGKHTTQFDVWGEAVNLAARMESSSKRNRVQVCADTYASCSREIEFESRGEINVKGIGTLNTYWIASP